MILFPDTNWLTAAYCPHLDDNRARIIERFSAKHGRWPWILSPLVYLEAKNVFARLAGQANGASWRRLLADVGQRLQIDPLNWERLQQRAFALSERYSHKAAVGSFDLAIIAHAGLCGATHFLSFDTGSSARALAAAEKMEVCPPLAEADKARLAALRR
jgi:hypothetical protein